jgi:hypothetical protein
MFLAATHERIKVQQDRPCVTFHGAEHEKTAW